MKLSIINEFTFHSTYYFLFISDKNDFSYLYINNIKNGMKSILYGDNFEQSISRLRQDPDINCIECNLVDNIIGGISFDNGVLAEFGLKKEKANKLISQLKEINNTKKLREF